MANYLFIESRDPYESADAARFGDLAVQLKRAGHEVAMFLVQNAVLPTRAGAKPLTVHHAIAAGIKVMADELSLRERGIGAGDIAKGVQSAPLDQVVTMLAAGWKTLWH